MDLLERMDRFVHATYLDRLAFLERPRPRNLRWTPLALIAAMVAGYALHAVPPGPPPFWPQLIGALLLWGGFAGTTYVRIFGPRLYDATGGLDERERAISASATAISGGAITVLASAGCVWMGVAGPFALPVPNSILLWIYLGVLIEGVAFALPVSIASWLQSRLPDDEG